MRSRAAASNARFPRISARTPTSVNHIVRSPHVSVGDSINPYENAAKSAHFCPSLEHRPTAARIWDVPHSNKTRCRSPQAGHELVRAIPSVECIPRGRTLFSGARTGSAALCRVESRHRVGSRVVPEARTAAGGGPQVRRAAAPQARTCADAQPSSAAAQQPTGAPASGGPRLRTHERNPHAIPA